MNAAHARFKRDIEQMHATGGVCRFPVTRNYVDMYQNYDFYKSDISLNGICIHDDLREFLLESAD